MVEVNVLSKLLTLYVNCVDGVSMSRSSAEGSEHVSDDMYSLMAILIFLLMVRGFWAF